MRWLRLPCSMTLDNLLGPDEDASLESIDAMHEDRASAWLAPHFGLKVTEPIRLHVAAKRYLCATDCNYRQILSPASVRSLELQGGLLNDDEVQLFESNPFHKDAVRLRRWDDRAKVPALAVPDLGHYAATMRRVLLRS